MFESTFQSTKSPIAMPLNAYSETQSTTWFYEIPDGIVPGLLQLSHEKKVGEPHSTLECEGKKIAVVDSKTYEIISDWLYSEERVQLKPHVLGKCWPIECQLSVVETSSFICWTKRICDEDEIMPRIISKAYGYQEVMTQEISNAIEQFSIGTKRLDSNNTTAIAIVNT